MPHPHILQKTMGEITATTRTTISGLYGNSMASSPEEVQRKSVLAQGMVMLWSEICFDMGVSQHLNLAAQEDLEALMRGLDAEDRQRFGMPPVIG
jgi:hypothetical protein